MKHHYCLPSVWQGVRRISALLVCLLFTFVFVVSPIKVKAEAFPIPPVWLPMNPYNAQGLEGNYVLLNDEQKEIVKEIIGAVNVVNLGFGQYVLMNPISGVQNSRQFLREYGGTFLETFWTQIMGTSRAMTDFVGSTIYKASTYDTLEEYEADTSPSVASGSQKYFEISPELTVAFKNWYRANGGVEDWQYKTKPFTSNFSWRTFPSSGTVSQGYESLVSSLSGDIVKVNNNSSSRYNSVSVLTHKWNLFVNTTSNVMYFVDDNGNHSDSIYGLNNTCVYQWATGNATSAEGNSTTYAMSYILNPQMSVPNGYTVVQAVQYFYNHLSDYLYSWSDSGYNKIFYNAEDVIKDVYAGTDWQHRERVYNVDDLNIGSTPSEYIDNISDTGFVDINTLIGQIADEVINLRNVVEESVLVKEGTDAVPYADSLKVAIDKYINQPESGVVIPSNIFGGLTGSNGPVSYLWYMTKPLVSYTGDLLGLLTLEGDGTFQFTGLGYIVIGVVTIGIIGGLVTKCLL